MHFYFTNVIYWTMVISYYFYTLFRNPRILFQYTFVGKFIPRITIIIDGSDETMRGSFMTDLYDFHTERNKMVLIIYN